MSSRDVPLDYTPTGEMLGQMRQLMHQQVAFRFRLGMGREECREALAEMVERMADQYVSTYRDLFDSVYDEVVSRPDIN